LAVFIKKPASPCRHSYQLKSEINYKKSEIKVVKTPGDIL
jgi:hypothetical protein